MADEAARREGMIKITELTNQANKLLEEATRVANETNNSFDFELGPCSMTYVPEKPADFVSSNCYDEDESVGWTTSRDYC